MSEEIQTQTGHLGHPGPLLAASSNSPLSDPLGVAPE